MRQMTNDFKIVGTLKGIFIEESTTKNGTEIVRGNVTVETDDKVGKNEFNINLFSFKYKMDGSENNLAKGYLTARDEYVIGERVSVEGSIQFDEYVKDNEYKSFNSLSGRFISRVKDTTPDTAFADVECLITDIEPMKNDDTIVDYALHCINIGYKDKLIPLQNLLIDKDIYDKVSKLYVVGATVKLRLQLINRVNIVESSEALFGNMEDVVKSYDREYRIVSGMSPYTDNKKLSDEEVMQVIQKRDQDYQILKSQIIPQGNAMDAGTGIGGFNEIPDFGGGFDDSIF